MRQQRSNIADAVGRILTLPPISWAVTQTWVAAEVRRWIPVGRGQHQDAPDAVAGTGSKARDRAAIIDC